MAKITVDSEKKRLTKIYKALPPNEFATAQGLIDNAARLRVMLDELWDDMQANGYTEMFAQSEKTEPYERERPKAKQYQTAVKNYKSIIDGLLALCPASKEKSKLEDLLNE